jgi:hypothetical protein
MGADRPLTPFSRQHIVFLVASVYCEWYVYYTNLGRKPHYIFTCCQEEVRCVVRLRFQFSDEKARKTNEASSRRTDVRGQRERAATSSAEQRSNLFRGARGRRARHRTRFPSGTDTHRFTSSLLLSWFISNKNISQRICTWNAPSHPLTGELTPHSLRVKTTTIS